MYQLITVPIISALIGYITNVIAIKMLFWPREPKSFYFFQLYGLLPKRRIDIARSIGEVVEEQLLSLDDILDNIDTPQMREALVNRIVEIVRVRISNALPGVVQGVFNNLLGNGVDRLLRQEADDVIKQAFVVGRAHLNNEIEIKKIVEDKINQLDIQQMEQLVRKVSSKELKFIEILGGVLGFLIGIIQVIILLIFPLK